MIWAGRLNANFFLVAFLAATLFVVAALIPYNMKFLGSALFACGAILICGAILVKIGFMLADVINRAVKGEPLVYDQKIHFDRAKGGTISE